jgi:hypothetical protein
MSGNDLGKQVPKLLGELFSSYFFPHARPDKSFSAPRSMPPKANKKQIFFATGKATKPGAPCLAVETWEPPPPAPKVFEADQIEAADQIKLGCPMSRGRDMGTPPPAPCVYGRHHRFIGGIITVYKRVFTEQHHYKPN